MNKWKKDEAYWKGEGDFVYWLSYYFYQLTDELHTVVASESHTMCWLLCECQSAIKTNMIKREYNVGCEARGKFILTAMWMGTFLLHQKLNWDIWWGRDDRDRSRGKTDKQSAKMMRCCLISYHHRHHHHEMLYWLLWLIAYSSVWMDEEKRCVPKLYLTIGFQADWFRKDFLRHLKQMLYTLN